LICGRSSWGTIVRCGWWSANSSHHAQHWQHCCF